jgi:hypothetical protein
MFVALAAPLLDRGDGLKIKFENGEYYILERSIGNYRYSLGDKPSTASLGCVPVKLISTFDKLVRDVEDGQTVFIMTDYLHFDLFGKGNIPSDCEYFPKRETLRYIPIKKFRNFVQIEKDSLKECGIRPWNHKREHFSGGPFIPISLVEKFD